MRKILFVLVLPLLLGCGESRMGKDNVPSAGTVTDSRAVDSSISIIQEALRLESAKENDKAALLEEMAFARMRRNPSEVSEVWQLLKTHIEKHKEDPADYMGRIDAFMVEVQEVLAECQTVSEFSLTWDVLQEIRAVMAEARDSLYSAALKEVNKVCQQISGKSASFIQDIESFVALRDTDSSTANGQALVMVLSSSLAAWDEGNVVVADTQQQEIAFKDLQDAVVSLLKTFLDKADSYFADAEDRLADEAEKDKSGNSVDPSPSNEGGVYQQMIVEFQVIATQIESADLGSWSVIAQTDFSERIENIGVRLTELSSKATELQMLRYNLWALLQIQLTETAQSWPEIMGSLDLQNLHQSLSALYSLSYDGLIRKESDPITRESCIRTLLSKDKIRLERF